MMSKPACASAGVQSGGAIGMWQSYFGKELLSYYGVDINYLCEEVFGGMPGVDITIGDQVRGVVPALKAVLATTEDVWLSVLNCRA